MTAKQWLLITGIIILNIIVVGSLLGGPLLERRGPPTPTWTAFPTFTPTPFPTATAILMPTLSPVPGAQPTRPGPVFHVVALGETVESIARRYGVSESALREANLIPDGKDPPPGRELTIPPAQP